jgi:hypothetical protein
MYFILGQEERTVEEDLLALPSGHAMTLPALFRVARVPLEAGATLELLKRARHKSCISPSYTQFQCLKYLSNSIWTESVGGDSTL